MRFEVLLPSETPSDSPVSNAGVALGREAASDGIVC